MLSSPGATSNTGGTVWRTSFPAPHLNGAAFEASLHWAQMHDERVQGFCFCSAYDEHLDIQADPKTGKEIAKEETRTAGD